MIKLIICQGIPASGKTTWARFWVNEKPKERIRVNRDDIRRQLGPYWVPSRESLVTIIENHMIVEGVKNGYSVVVDATNLNGEDRFYSLSSNNNLWEKGVEIETKDFDVDIEECIRRDSLRPKEEQVGEKVISDMYNKYKKIK